MLTLAFVTGTEPAKWFRRFRDSTSHGLTTRDSDDAFAALQAGEAELALTRLPDVRVTDEFFVVTLYDEEPGVAVPKESVYAEVGEAVQLRDLDGEHINEYDTIDELRAALQVVAANVGIAFGPKPLLKVLSKKQVVPLTLKGGSEPVTIIALVWRKAEDSDAIQDFVGVAKGRTLNSSRAAAPKRTAKEKRLAKEARRGNQSPQYRGRKKRS
ncbi:LysR family transcriptional regulator substrate-binding protein [Corynebacterium lubricantis]|uniref:LysR family transcriptional regulator substrate-binding protein n=1 Tax=Corynebacterium lubricantis TaxID=541095 RepID=UPI00036CC484|nr:LysR family transcriptional regulator substrate-binding protein [Corynebacterium lubricantis]